MTGVGFEYRKVMLCIAALQIQAMKHYPGGAVQAASFPHFWQTYQTYPYFTNRLGAIGITSDSESLDAAGFDVVMRLNNGPITSGETGEKEAQLQQWAGWIIKYFNERESLQSKAYPDGADNIDYARISASPQGIVAAQGVTTETQEFVMDFTLRVTARDCIGLDYNGDGY
jgi:hypothetical protein